MHVAMAVFIFFHLPHITIECGWMDGFDGVGLELTCSKSSYCAQKMPEPVESNLPETGVGPCVSQHSNCFQVLVPHLRVQNGNKTHAYLTLSREAILIWSASNLGFETGNISPPNARLLSS